SPRAPRGRRTPPQQAVPPQRRSVQEFTHRREADDDEAGEQDDADGRPVAGIREPVVEAASRAPRRRGEEAGEQRPLAAARTPAGKAGQDRRRTFGFRHRLLPWGGAPPRPPRAP